MRRPVLNAMAGLTAVKPQADRLTDSGNAWRDEGIDAVRPRVATKDQGAAHDALKVGGL